MGSWRLRWAYEEIADRSNFLRHRQVIDSSWKFWFALIAKFIPLLWVFPVELRFREGGIVNVKDFMTLYIYKEIFVDKCYDDPPLSAQNPRIIDVGANTGLFAIRMKQLYPQAHVHCYEPFPPNFSQLENNIAQSQFKSCFLHKRGVGGRTRTEKLFVHNTNIGGHSIFKSQSRGGSSIDIEIVDLERVLMEVGPSVCHLMKLDCEGAEYEIIKSMNEKTARSIERIIFEATPGIYDIKELVQHLEGIGYRVAMRNGLWLATYDSGTVCQTN